MTRLARRLTDAEIDRIVLGTKIGGAGRGAPSLAAARDYLARRYRTIKQAADAHDTTRQATGRVVDQLCRLAVEDAQRAGCVQVGVLIPGEAVEGLAEWVSERGGEVVG